MTQPVTKIQKILTEATTAMNGILLFPLNPIYDELAKWAREVRVKKGPVYLMISKDSLEFTIKELSNMTLPVCGENVAETLITLTNDFSVLSGFDTAEWTILISYMYSANARCTDVDFATRTKTETVPSEATIILEYPWVLTLMILEVLPLSTFRFSSPVY